MLQASPRICPTLASEARIAGGDANMLGNAVVGRSERLQTYRSDGAPAFLAILNHDLLI